MKINRRNLLKTLSLTGLGSALGLQAQSTGNGGPECLTTTDIQGPFYRPGAPSITALAPADAPGTPLFVTGTVYANDCTTPVVNALLDVWHANDGGGYENEHYRGKITTGANGQYAFQTILPGKYLNGALFRPRHFHFKVSFGETLLTTQIYFEGDTSIPSDPWASTPDAAERIITLATDQQENLHGVVDIYLDVAPIINDLDRAEPKHQGAHIQSIYPNPLKANGQVAIHLPRAGKIDLRIFDLQGRMVKEVLPPTQVAGQKYTVDFIANNSLDIRLTNSVYLLQLSFENEVVDVKRFVIL